ncbi:MAG: hypothetical protein QM750_22110 [Rubrivivax sp.]
MGQQFTYYCLAEDLERIQTQVFRPANGQLVASEKTNGTHTLVSVDSFPLANDQMGKQTVFLYLLPPKELQREVRNGPWIDHSKSHLIEVGRCFTDGRIIRSARFWYETRYFEGNELRVKPAEFVSWAEGVFRSTKKTLQRHPINRGGHVYTEWFGLQAWNEVSSARLSPVSCYS